MLPFFVETLTGTRPERATGRSLDSSKLSGLNVYPDNSPGSVETTPKIRLPTELARMIWVVALNGSNPTISPGTRLLSSVRKFSAKSRPPAVMVPAAVTLSVILMASVALV